MMNNKPRRAVLITVILIALSLTGLAAFALGYPMIANDNDSEGSRPGPMNNPGVMAGY